MLTSKQRSKLRGMANAIEPVTQVGKGGITTNMIRTLSSALEARELIKVTVLESSGEAAKEMINTLANELQAEPIQTVGSKITLYRRSEKKGIEHIELD
ncbi:MAG: ribosome assembly RNA-binding protein YhbY [Clostridia bacterium]|nr:ribosome assembly RNA-binding protein YhbY [Clostridia bacterium]